MFYDTTTPACSNIGKNGEKILENEREDALKTLENTSPIMYYSYLDPGKIL